MPFIAININAIIVTFLIIIFSIIFIIVIIIFIIVIIIISIFIIIFIIVIIIFSITFKNQERWLWVGGGEGSGEIYKSGERRGEMLQLLM